MVDTKAGWAEKEAALVEAAVVEARAEAATATEEGGRAEEEAVEGA